MPYIGRPLNAGNLAVQSGTGDGSDTTPIATLDYSVGSSNSIGVYLDGVRQLAGTDFTASGTVLTFTTAPANGVGIDVYFLGLELSIPTPADATVTAAKLASNAVTTVKIIDDAVTLAKMASGTDGNIISYDASGNPVAIATGSDGQVLTSAGAGQPCAFETLAGGGPSQVSTTYDLSTATGNIAITGAGFAPTMIHLYAVVTTSTVLSFGWGDEDLESRISNDHAKTATKWVAGGTLGLFRVATSDYVLASIVSLDADGCTLNMGKTGSPTGTLQTKIIFFR